MMTTRILVLFLLVNLFFACRPQEETVNGPVSLGLQPIAEGFTAPLALIEEPAGQQRLFVIDQPGQIWILPQQQGQERSLFLDLSDKIISLNPGYDERGLLSLAFHPQYQENGRFFVYYSAPLRSGGPSDWDNTSIVSEFRVADDNPDQADPASEKVIMQIDQPQSNHAGATLLFGPDDGYLYISLGDGGGAHDTGRGHVDDWYEANDGGNAQNIEANFLGKILRIDVDNGDPYAIPQDNPFVDHPGLDEIYAYGLRNPYRMSFDLQGACRLFAMDAGQDLYEEVNIIEKGGNYGWNVKEGTHCFDTDNPRQPREDCPDADVYGNHLIDPVIEFKNSQLPGGLGNTVIGGHVYRGQAIPHLQGRYIFGVWRDAGNGGAIFESEPMDAGLWPINRLSFEGGFTHSVLAFGQTSDGEVYVLTSDRTGPAGDTGRVLKIVAREAS
jgi:glucose/arabinose dehydrogenase